MQNRYRSEIGSNFIFFFCFFFQNIKTDKLSDQNWTFSIVRMDMTKVPKMFYIKNFLNVSNHLTYQEKFTDLPLAQQILTIDDWRLKIEDMGLRTFLSRSFKRGVIFFFQSRKYILKFWDFLSKFFSHMLD